MKNINCLAYFNISNFFLNNKIHFNILVYKRKFLILTLSESYSWSIFSAEYFLKTTAKKNYLWMKKDFRSQESLITNVDGKFFLWDSIDSSILFNPLWSICFLQDLDHRAPPWTSRATIIDSGGGLPLAHQKWWLEAAPGPHTRCLSAHGYYSTCSFLQYHSFSLLKNHFFGLKTLLGLRLLDLMVQLWWPLHFGRKLEICYFEIESLT